LECIRRIEENAAGGREQFLASHTPQDRANRFTVGQTGFHAKDPIIVGMHAVGTIDPTVYHRAFPARTAIRLESLQLLRWDSEK
jgi:hypothetical protein